MCHHYLDSVTERDWERLVEWGEADEEEAEDEDEDPPTPDIGQHEISAPALETTTIPELEEEPTGR